MKNDADAGSPRERMVKSAALLMQQHGVEAMSFSQVVSLSGAPRGSIYHYFPGGKAQLVEEAVRYSEEYIAERAGAALATGGPIAALEWSGEFWQDVLGGSDFGSGCPVVAATLEGERTPGARAAAERAFRRWMSAFGGSLQEYGVAEDRARVLATTVFASMEGAVILARAQRSMEPIKGVLAELRTLVSAALSEAGR